MADITVHGAGIFGLSVAWACVRRGARVTVVDPGGVAAGASGGLVGALAPHTPERWNEKKQFQFESLVMAEAMWAEVAEISGQDPGYARLGRLQPLTDDHAIALAREREAAARTLWQGRFHWRVVDAAPFAGYADVSTGLCVHDTLSARVHPRRATRALAGALRRLGVDVVPDPPERRGVEIWATGVTGLRALTADTGQPAGDGVKGQAALVDFDGRDLPQLFAEALHVVPHGDGTTALGSTSERDYSDPSSTDALLDDVIARARAACPALAGARVLERWAGLRPRARSRAPMIGPHPARPGAFIANGGFKIGFGMAPGVGKVLADLVLDGVDRIPESFRPEASLRG